MPDQQQERQKQLMDEDKCFNFMLRKPVEEELGSVVPEASPKIHDRDLPLSHRQR